MSKDFGEAAARVITKGTKGTKTSSPDHIEVATFAAGIGAACIDALLIEFCRVLLGSGALLSTRSWSYQDRGNCYYSQTFRDVLKVGYTQGHKKDPVFLSPNI